MNCPKCRSEKLVKDGIIKTRQRYLCKDCDYRHTVVCKSTGKSAEIKRMALMMYLEGLGFNSIARILKVSHVAVLKWIRAYGQQLVPLRSVNLTSAVGMSIAIGCHICESRSFRD